MKKLLVFMSAGIGGAERMSIQIAKNLPPSEYDIKFVVVGEEAGYKSVQSFLPDGYKCEFIKGTAKLFHLLSAFNGLLRKEKPDIVFSSIKPISIKLLILKLFHGKVKFVIRCDNYLSYYSGLGRLMVKHYYKKADTIIAQTEEMKRELTDASIRESKIHVLQNPIDKDIINEKLKEPAAFEKNGKKKYVAIGRFSPDKGFDTLVRAFAIVANYDRSAELFIVGKNDGYAEDYYNQLKEIVVLEKLTGRIHFPGFSTNPYSYLKNADCYVMSSRREGLPNTLLEALYMGIPAAATMCIPIVGRIITDGENGYAAVMDDPSSLAEAMMKASKLGKVNLGLYKSATYEDFTNIFREL